MKSCLFLFLFILISPLEYANGQKKPASPDHNIRRVVLGGGLNISHVEKYYGIGTDLDLKVRLNQGRHLIGIGGEAMFSLNKKREEKQELEFFTGDTNTVLVGYRLFTIAAKAEYHYYLIDPVTNKFSLRLGAQLGPVVQIPESDYFSVNELIDAKPLPFFEIGFICGPLLGIEYFEKNMSFYGEFGAYYHYVNKYIPIVDGSHFFSGSVKLGLRFNFGPLVSSD